MSVNDNKHRGEKRRRDTKGARSPRPSPNLVVGRTQSVACADEKDVRQWLKEIKLEQYANDLIDQGYDDVDDLKHSVDLDEIEQTCQDIKMLNGHVSRLLRTLRKVRSPMSLGATSLGVVEPSSLKSFDTESTSVESLESERLSWVPSASTFSPKVENEVLELLLPTVASSASLTTVATHNAVPPEPFVETLAIAKVPIFPVDYSQVGCLVTPMPCVI